jgi:hypothetical protein
MGQHTEHHHFTCPCGAGSVDLTSTRFSTQGARRLHTELVRCAVCKGRYRFSFVEQDGRVLGADAEERATGMRVRLG